LLLNLPEGIWRAEYSREEVLDIVKEFLAGGIFR
jgi:hypothetical protein